MPAIILVLQPHKPTHALSGSGALLVWEGGIVVLSESTILLGKFTLLACSIIAFCAAGTIF